MRTLQLPSGRIVKVGVHHTELDRGDHYFRLAGRATVAIVELENGGNWTAVARCSTQDQFVKRTGRLIAMRRMNRQLRDFFTRADRGVICAAIFANKKVSLKNFRVQTIDA